MKKRLLALLLVLCTLFLSSCSLKESLQVYREDLNIIRGLSERKAEYKTEASLDFDRNRDVLDNMEDRYKKINEIIESGNVLRFYTLITLFSRQMQDFYYLADQTSLAFVAFSKNTKKSDAQEGYTELSELVNDHQTRITALYRRIYDSAFRRSFFAGWPKSELDEILLRSDACSEEFTALKNEISREIKEYQQLDQSSDTFAQKSAESYYRIVHANMRLAEKLGYDSYPEYAYKYVYGRDYTPGEAKELYKYVKQYLIPRVEDIKSFFTNSRPEKVQAYNDLAATAVDEDEMVNRLTPYYEKLGDRFADSFKSFQDHTYTGSKNGLSNAFTSFLYYYKHPVCYFGPDYQNLMTYVHEQGHYNAFALSLSNFNSFDLCETHSQGNEWLYMSYLSEQFKSKKGAYSFITNYHLYDAYLISILAICCDAFEQYVYAHPELIASDYDRVFIEQATEIGAYDYLKKNIRIAPENYWHIAIVANSMYYISYAVSKIPSVELFVIAQTEGFDTAVEKYNKLIDVSADAGFKKTIADAGLGSPFTEDPYTRIDKYFKESKIR